MTKNIETYVDLNGITFMIKGEVVDRCLNDYAIFIEDYDVTDVLKSSVVDDICDEALYIARHGIRL